MSYFRWIGGAAIAVSLLATMSCGGGGGKKTARIVVMDQNVLHGFSNEDQAAEPYDRIGERIKLIAKALAGEKPDLISLQEIYINGPPDYPDVRADLRQALSETYTQTFGDFLGDPIGEGGIGQLTLTHLPLISTENQSVSKIRSVQRITVQTDLGPVSIYNAHLEGTGALLETGQPAELAEIGKVIGFINETRGGGPAILSGDLNAEPGDPSIQRLIQEGFIDAVATAGDATCAKAGDPGCTNSALPLGDNPNNNADHRIDYVFVLAGDKITATVKQAALWDNKPVDIGGGRLLWPSDHIGVRAVIELKEK